jgi:hypothetical protein
MREMASRFFTRLFACCVAAGAFWLTLPVSARAQENSGLTAAALSVDLPEAPQPEFGSEAAVQEPGTTQNRQPQVPASSSSQPHDKPLSPDEERQQRAEEQLSEQKKQRMLGILPMFNTSYRDDAVSLKASEKMKLAFRTSIDPATFGITAVVAGFGELNGGDNNKGFGWGPEGYFKRWGAAYLDSFNGMMIGNGILPSIFHQDPRYFRLGRGSATHRLLYAMATTVICRHDNSKRWEPNYSNVGGNLIAGYVSNLYYPDTDRSGWEQTLASGFVVTAEGTFGGILQEFWPDISRKLFKKDPTHGLDAQAGAADAAAQQNKEKKQPLPPAPK